MGEIIVQSFRLKGSLFTLSVLQLMNADLEVLAQGLHDKISQAPKFFQNAPIVIDLAKIDLRKHTLDLAKLHQILTSHNLVPVGVRTNSTSLANEAIKAGFALMSDLERSHQTEPTRPASTTAKDNLPTRTPQQKKTTTLSAKGGSRLITKPIRSGQQVYVEGGDLVVVASVSPGAELLADGNIHIYGTLRGRALAGINGDERARIFCHKLEAELVSIAGNYKIFEDIQEHTSDKSFKQLYLNNGQLVIDSL